MSEAAGSVARMTRYRYYVASSLDGFLADRDGSLDWLLAFGMEEFAAGYRAFIAEVGAIVMGRSTYDFVHGEGPDAWDYEVPAWVLTHRDADGVPGRDIRFRADSPAAL